MHVSDALISPEIGLTFLAVSAGTCAYAIRKIDLENEKQKLPLVGVMGAFTFAAQMINFTIPGTGASGHLTGGLMLSILLGPHLAFITMMSLLLIQALFFADGGLIAYGVNVFNMGVISCYLVYPFVFKPLLNKVKQRKLPFIVSGVIALSIAAIAVVFETTLSGVSALPLGIFMGMMVPIHIAIGLVEGLVTASVVHYIWRFMPEIKNTSVNVSERNRSERSIRGIAGIFAAAIIVAGGLSFYASSNPDGLEWSIMKTANQMLETPQHPVGEQIQSAVAFFKDYQISAFGDSGLSGGLAGIIGSMFTLLLVGGVLIVVKFIKRNEVAQPANGGTKHEA